MEPILPISLLIIGGYLSWFGIHYFKSDVTYPTDPIKAVLTGKSLPANTTASTDATLSSFITAGGSTTSTTAAVTGASSNSIAAAALKYVGQGYVYGGNASKPGDWDCSSFVSYVLGHDLKLPLPGGTFGSPGFPPNSHGPTTLQYMLFGTPVNANQALAGDIVVDAEHMGIVTGTNEMVSALNETLGTATSTISSTMTGTIYYRRVKA